MYFDVHGRLCDAWLGCRCLCNCLLVNLFNRRFLRHDCRVLVSVDVRLVPSDCFSLFQIGFDPQTKHLTFSLFVQKLVSSQQLHVSKLIQVDSVSYADVVDVN